MLVDIPVEEAVDGRVEVRVARVAGLSIRQLRAAGGGQQDDCDWEVEHDDCRQEILRMMLSLSRCLGYILHVRTHSHNVHANHLAATCGN